MCDRLVCSLFCVGLILVNAYADYLHVSYKTEGAHGKPKILNVIEAYGMKIKVFTERSEGRTLYCQELWNSSDKLTTGECYGPPEYSDRGIPGDDAKLQDLVMTKIQNGENFTCHSLYSFTREPLQEICVSKNHYRISDLVFGSSSLFVRIFGEPMQTPKVEDSNSGFMYGIGHSKLLIISVIATLMHRQFLT